MGKNNILQQNEHSLWGVVTPKGKVILPFKYDKIVLLKNGYINAKIEDKWFLFNSEGTLCLKEKLFEQVMCTECDSCIFITYSTKKYGVYSFITDKSVISPIYDNIIPLYLTRGKWISNPQMSYLEHKEILYKVEINYTSYDKDKICITLIKKGILNRLGKMLFPIDYYDFEVQQVASGGLERYIIVARRRNCKGNYVCDLYNLYFVEEQPVCEFKIGGFVSFLQECEHFAFLYEVENKTMYDAFGVLMSPDTINDGFWLITDCNFISAFSDYEGNRYYLNRKLDELDENGNPYYCALPEEIIYPLNKYYSPLVYNYQIVLDKIELFKIQTDCLLINDKLGIQLVFFQNGKVINFLEKVTSINQELALAANLCGNLAPLYLYDDEFYFVKSQRKDFNNNYYIGIVSKGDWILSASFFAISYPVSGYVLAIKENIHFMYDIYLYNIEYIDNFKLTVYEQLPLNIVKKMIKEYSLGISVDSNGKVIVAKNSFSKYLNRQCAPFLSFSEDVKSCTFYTDYHPNRYSEEDYDWWSQEQLDDAYMAAMEDDLRNEWNID